MFRLNEDISTFNIYKKILASNMASTRRVSLEYGMSDAQIKKISKAKTACDLGVIDTLPSTLRPVWLSGLQHAKVIKGLLVEYVRPRHMHER